MSLLPSPETLLAQAAHLGILRELLASELLRVQTPVQTPAQAQPQAQAQAPDRHPGAPILPPSEGPMGPFEAALRQAPCPVIAEFKRGSPSRGPFAAGAQVRERLERYAAGGAAAFSILAEPARFLGRPSDFAAACGLGRPVLYKGFTCSQAHLEEARALGAQAVLLIARLLGEHLPAFAQAARERGLEPLVEIHALEELPRVQAAGARLVGWNARDLSDFSVGATDVARLRRALPGALLVRESGLGTPEAARAALAEGFDALLIGEALMRHPDPAAFLAQVTR